MAKEIRPLYRTNDSTGVDEIFYPATITDAIAHPTKQKSLTDVLGEIENGSVYDISAAHNNQPYADLSAALDSNNGGGVPQSLQKGGMSVKFIQGSVGSSDHKYVQYRYMGTDVTDTNIKVVGNWSEIKDVKYLEAGINNFDLIVNGNRKDIYFVDGYNQPHGIYNFKSGITYIFSITPTSSEKIYVGIKAADGSTIRGTAGFTTFPAIFTITPVQNYNNAYLDLGSGVAKNFAVEVSANIYNEKEIDDLKTEVNTIEGNVDQGAVFDVSEKYPTSGVEGGNTYTLEGALAVLDANLSSNKKKGGMSIKFIQSSPDNKYVQYRLTSKNFNTTSSNWEKLISQDEFTITKDKVNTYGSYISLWKVGSYGSNGVPNDNSNFLRTDKIPFVYNDVLTLSGNLNMYRVNMFDANGNSLGQGGFEGGISFTINHENCAYIGITVRKNILSSASDISTVLLYKNGKLVSIYDTSLASLYFYTKQETDALLNNKANSNDVYTKQQVDDSLSIKANVSDVYTKAEATSNFTTKSEYNNHEERIDSLENELPIIDGNLNTINSSLSSLVANPPSGGAVSGDNTWTGENTFTQAVKGVSASNDNEFVTLGQVKNTLHRFVDVADYGADPANAASTNVTAINTALNGGNKTVIISKPGTYMLNGTLLFDDNTELVCGNGVVLKKETAYANVIRNRGGETRTTNYNIILRNVNIDCNSKYDNSTQLSSPLYGGRGQILMFHVNNVQMYNITINNATVYAIQLCTFENVIIDGFKVQASRGDGVHINRGNNLICRNGEITSGDDAIPLNAADWISSTPEVGSIHDCLFENITHNGPTSNTITHLVGKWVDWYDGMDIVNGDKVVSNGHVYRASVTGNLRHCTSHTQPNCNAETGTQEDSGGFTWRLSNLDAVYEASIWNVTYRNITTKGTGRGIFAYAMITVPETGTIYDRGIYPDIQVSDYPYVKGILVDGMWLYNNTQVFVTVSSSIKGQYVIKNIKHNNAAQFITTESAGETVVSIEDSNLNENTIKIGNSSICFMSNNYGSPSVNCFASGKIICNHNVASLPSANVKGARCSYNDEPYYNNGTSWINMVV